MAWGRHAPRMVQTERGGAARAVADTERLGVDPDLSDRPAHAWEVDEGESWESVAPDTWEPPEDAGPEAEVVSDDEEAWRDSARMAYTRAQAEADQAAPPDDRTTGGESRGSQADRATEPVERSPQAAPDDEAGKRPQPPPARLALGLASMAAQRMRGGVPAGDGLVTGFGLMRQTVNGLVALGERLLAPASRAAAGVVRRAEALPVVGPPIYAGLRSREWLAQSRTQARAKIAAVAARLGELGREQGQPSPQLIEALEATRAGAGRRAEASTVDEVRSPGHG